MARPPLGKLRVSPPEKIVGLEGELALRVVGLLLARMVGYQVHTQEDPIVVKEVGTVFDDSGATVLALDVVLARSGRDVRIRLKVDETEVTDA